MTKPRAPRKRRAPRKAADRARAARAALEAGVPADAVVAATDAIAFDATHAPAWEALADAHRAAGDLDAAIEAGRTITGLLPDAAWAWSSLAGDLADAGRHADAAQALERAVVLEPTAGDWYNLACYRARAGRADDALGALATAIQHDPEMAAVAFDDADLATLRGDTRFRALAHAR